MPWTYVFSLYYAYADDVSVVSFILCLSVCSVFYLFYLRTGGVLCLAVLYFPSLSSRSAACLPFFFLIVSRPSSLCARVRVHVTACVRACASV